MAKILGAYEEYYRLTFVNEQKEAFQDIEDKLSSASIVIFIRGTQIVPMCRASRQMVESLDNLEIKYKSYDILENAKTKEWLKFYANWPGYPQLYIYGKFIGGTEIMQRLIEQDDFMSMIPSECIRTNAIERITTSLASGVVILFIKGTKLRPFDGYQRAALEILDESNVRYKCFNVLNDPDLREILKEISRFASYPQLFIEKKFVGGLNFLKNA